MAENTIKKPVNIDVDVNNVLSSEDLEKIADYIPSQGQCAILVAGSREYENKIEITKHVSIVVSAVLEKTTLDNIRIVEGEARGVDSYAREVGEFLGIIVRKFPANWEKYGKSAGMIRNGSMARFCAKYNGILIAFWDGKSRGTKNMIQTARKNYMSVITVKI